MVMSQHNRGNSRVMGNSVLELALCGYLHVHVSCGRDSVLLWRQCGTLCTSSFADDVMLTMWRVSKTAYSQSDSQELRPGAKSWYLRLPCQLLAKRNDELTGCLLSTNKYQTACVPARTDRYKNITRLYTLCIINPTCRVDVCIYVCM